MKSIGSRLTALEQSAQPTDQEIIDYLTRCTPLSSDSTLQARIEFSTPDYIRQMTNEELIAFVTGEGVQHEH